MKLLAITEFNSNIKSIATLAGYSKFAKKCGHKFSIYGNNNNSNKVFHFSKNFEKYDFLLFIIHNPNDLPGLPDLANILDNTTKKQRVVIDCVGYYNKTIRVGSDFNHLEKLDGHQGWEWIDAIKSISNTILQPTIEPLQKDVSSFLFHGFNHYLIVNSSNNFNIKKWKTRKNGIVFSGHNWQKWTQISKLLIETQVVMKKIGFPLLTGYNWDQRPSWAIDKGLMGAYVDSKLMKKLNVSIKFPIQYDKVIKQASKGKFTPIIHRPLFNRLNFITNRTFESFCMDTIPIILYKPKLAKYLYGDSSKMLIPGNDIHKFISNVLSNPKLYWDIVIDIRDYLIKKHTFEQRYSELAKLLVKIK